MTMTRTSLLKVFFAAVVIRWVYDVAIFAAFGAEGLLGVDSHDYIHYAAVLAGHLREGSLHGWQWLGANPVMMPLFYWLVTAVAYLAGDYTALAYVLLQGVIDAGTCLLVFSLASIFKPAFGVPAAVAAVINPTQIVLAGLVYTDTPFVFLVTLALLAALRWMERPSIGWTVTLGLSLGAAALVRAMIVPFVGALLVFLAIVTLLRRDAWRAPLVQVVAIGVLFAVCIAPVLLRNANVYGSWNMTSQSGMHLSRWVVPLVREAKDGTPWNQTYMEMEKRRDERYGPDSGNQFIESDRYVTLAKEELRNLGLAAIAKAWLFGAALNIGSPAIIISPPVAQLPRQGFYSTTGATVVEKVWNFVFRADNTLYAMALLLGITGVAAIRLLQLGGAIRLMLDASNIAALLLLAGWIGFILLVNGPVAAPKYRLPLEPVFNVMTGAGWVWLTRRRARADAA